MTAPNRYPGSSDWPTTHPVYPVNHGNDSPAPDPADTVLQLLAAALTSRITASQASMDHGPRPMLTVAQTAALLGVSRTTVIRMADAGQLPCVVVARGGQKKTRRFPRSFIEELILGKSSSTSPE
jgi:excisionase family DNA binding protein